MSKVVVIICSALFVLGGCATQAERQGQQMAVEWDDAQIKVNNCLQQARITKEYRVLNMKFILDTPDPAAAQKMAIHEFASQEDKNNAISYRATFKPYCYRRPHLATARCRKCRTNKGFRGNSV